MEFGARELDCNSRDFDISEARISTKQNEKNRNNGEPQWRMCYEAVVVCELLLCCCCWCSRSALTTERLKVSNGTERGWTRVRARKPSSTIVHTHTHTRATARNTMATTERQHSIGRQRKSARERALRCRRVSFPTQRAVWTVDCGPLCTGTARRHKLCCLLHTAKGIIWINSLWQLRVIPCCLQWELFK